MAGAAFRTGLEVSLVSPSRLLFEGEVMSVQLPTTDGLIGILPGHVPMLSLLGFGTLILKDIDGEQRFVVEGGFLEVSSDHVTILANNAVPVSELDLDGSEKSLEEALAMTAANDFEQKQREEAILTARARLRALETSGSQH